MAFAKIIIIERWVDMSKLFQLDLIIASPERELWKIIIEEYKMKLAKFKLETHTLFQ